MKLIVSLGNPGKEYEHTRHNAGFLALDFAIADFGLQISDFKKKFDAEVLEENLEETKVLFAKPQVFMNNSGKTVKGLLEYYKLDPKRDLLVVHDDADLKLGTWKVADNSSSAGHKGVQSIIDALGTQSFHRVRIGIDSRESRLDVPTEDFVLQRFSVEEATKLNDVFPQVARQIRSFLTA